MRICDDFVRNDLEILIMFLKNIQKRPDLIRLNMNIDYHSQLTFRQAVHNCGYNLYHINRHFQPKLSLRTEKVGSLFRGFRA